MVPGLEKVLNADTKEAQVSPGDKGDETNQRKQ